MRTAPALLALAFLAAALPAGSLGPALPAPAYDLDVVKAQLQREALSPHWALLPDGAVPARTWDIALPAPGAPVVLDLATGLLRTEPAPEHDGEDAGCLDYGGAFAVWMPSPPEVYPLCTGYQEHQGTINELTLLCAGYTTGFGCAIVGVEIVRQVYFAFLCGYPEGPLVGIEWPEQGVHMNCALYGEDPTSWRAWAATLSANGGLFTAGYLAH